MTKVAVVTGSNQGIGFAIVRALCKKFDGEVILTSRSVENGEKAVDELKKEGLNPKLHQLDILDKASIESLKKFLVDNYGGLDILVNNAGIAYNKDSTAPFPEQVEVSMKTNFWATLNVCDALFPILRARARVANVSTFVSQMMLAKCSDDLKKRILACSTIDDVKKLMTEFEELTKAGTHTEHGWPNSAYGTTKLGLTAASLIQHQDISKDTSRPDIVVNACCPGYVSTNMSNYKGHLTPDEGAVTPVYCALLPPNVESPRGKFISECKIGKWE